MLDNHPPFAAYCKKHSLVEKRGVLRLPVRSSALDYVLPSLHGRTPLMSALPLAHPEIWAVLSLSDQLQVGPSIDTLSCELQHLTAARNSPLSCARWTQAHVHYALVSFVFHHALYWDDTVEATISQSTVLRLMDRAWLSFTDLEEYVEYALGETGGVAGRRVGPMREVMESLRGKALRVACDHLLFHVEDDRPARGSGLWLDAEDISTTGIALWASPAMLAVSDDEAFDSGSKSFETGEGGLSPIESEEEPMSEDDLWTAFSRV